MKTLTFNSQTGFGRLLEVNILGAQKVCNFDCSYCNLGRSQYKLGQIRDDVLFPSVDDITGEVARALSAHLRSDSKLVGVPLDGILVSGNGEPSLHPEFERFMKALAEQRNELMPTLKIYVMTNGDRLSDRSIVRALEIADERIVKVDIGTETGFQLVNRPISRSNLDKIIRGARILSDCIVQSAVKVDAAFLHSTHIDEWIEVIGMIGPKMVYLHPVREGEAPVDMDEVFRVAHLLERRTKVRAHLSVESAA